MPVQLFTNGQIFTSDPADNGKLHEAMVVEGTKVKFVGNVSDAERLAKSLASSYSTTDFGGKVVLPGFTDAHCHLAMMGSAAHKVETAFQPLEEIQKRLRQARKQNPDAEMILGKNFMFDFVGKPCHRKDLDDAVSDVPVFIDNFDLHSAWVNSVGLRVLGITKDTPDPEGGEIARDEDGEPTGLLIESASLFRIYPYVVSHTTDEARAAQLASAFNMYLACGVTSCVDMAMTDDDLQLLEAFYHSNRNRLPVRVACHWLIPPEGTEEDRLAVVKAGLAHRERLEKQGMAPWLQIVGIKIICDGVVDGCTAFLKKPYASGALPGPIWTPEQLEPIIRYADANDLQVACHAIGDAASEMALDIYESVIKTNGPRSARRHRIEHLEVVTKESIRRLTDLKIIASVQPVHADPAYAANWHAMLGHDERTERGFPWMEYVDAKSEVAFGSDAPTAPHHTLTNLYTATTRQSGVRPELPRKTDPTSVKLEKFAIPLETAIRFYTLGSAYSRRAEKELGSLQPGKTADFCVLSIDPFGDSLESLKRAQEAVVQTYIEGQLVYEKAT